MEANHEICLGCGEDLQASRERRKLSSDSIASSGPRENVLSEWKIIITRELQNQGTMYDQVFKDPENPGKMCKKCFRDFEKFYKLSSQLRSKLAVPVNKLLSLVTSSSDFTTSRISNASDPTQQGREGVAVRVA